MTNTEQLNQVRAKIVEARPDLLACEKFGTPNPITLADVIRAIETANPNGEKYGDMEFWFADDQAYPDKKGYLGFYHPENEEEKLYWWNFAEQLDGQSESFISFLHKILCQ